MTSPRFSAPGVPISAAAMASGGVGDDPHRWWSHVPATQRSRWRALFDAGLTDELTIAREAVAWYQDGVSPDVAAPWVAAGVPAEIGFEWCKYALAPADRVAWNAVGVDDALIAKMLIERGEEPNRPTALPETYPLRLVASFARDYDGIWAALDDARTPATPNDFGAIGMASAKHLAALVGVALSDVVPEVLTDSYGGVLRRQAERAFLYGGWRLTQGVYRFDPALRA